MDTTKTDIAYVRFDSETLDRLRELAERRDRTIAAIIRAAVSQYLKKSAA